MGSYHAFPGNPVFSLVEIALTVIRTGPAAGGGGLTSGSGYYGELIPGPVLQCT